MPDRAVRQGMPGRVHLSLRGERLRPPGTRDGREPRSSPPLSATRAPSLASAASPIRSGSPLRAIGRRRALVVPKVSAPHRPSRRRGGCDHTAFSPAYSIRRAAVKSKSFVRRSPVTRPCGKSTRSHPRRHPILPPTASSSTPRGCPSRTGRRPTRRAYASSCRWCPPASTNASVSEALQGGAPLVRQRALRVERPDGDGAARAKPVAWTQESGGGSAASAAGVDFMPMESVRSVCPAVAKITGSRTSFRMRWPKSSPGRHTRGGGGRKK